MGELGIMTGGTGVKFGDPKFYLVCKYIPVSINVYSVSICSLHVYNIT